MRRTLRLLSASAGAVALSGTSLIVLSSHASAVDFPTADFVVYQVGSAGGTLTNAGAPVTLATYPSDGAGIPKTSVEVPAATVGAQHRLTATGLSRSEGQLTRSEDGAFVTFTGYDAAVGQTGPDGGAGDVAHLSLTASDPTAVGRIVGLLDGAGNLNTATSLVGAAVPHVVRAAATADGEHLYLGGSSGVLMATRGSSTAASVLDGSGAAFDANSLLLSGGQLLASGADDGQLGKRLVSVGGGAPTAASPITGLPGLATGLLPGGFVLLDLTDKNFLGTGGDTLYAVNAAEKAGAVDKFSFDGTSWTKQGAVGLEGATGLAARVLGQQVLLAATTPTALYALGEQDGSAAGFTSAAPAVLASAGAGTEFRGVALAPSGAALAKPTVAITSPASGSHLAGNTTSVAVSGSVTAHPGVASVTVSADGGSPVTATVSGSAWSATIPVAPTVGTHSLTATATDTESTPASTSTESSFVLDPGPRIAATAPAQGQHISYLTSSLLAKGTASDPRGISAVTIALDSGAPAAAVTSGGGTAWSKTYDLTKLAVGTHRLTVKVVEKTSGFTSTLVRTFIRDGVPKGAIGPSAVSFFDPRVARTTGWRSNPYPASPDRRSLLTTVTPKVRFTTFGKGLDLHFQRRADGGIARLTVDGRAYVIDLKSPRSGDAVKALRGLSAGKHTVTIQALHQRSAGSRGFVIVLGYLRVYA